MLILQSVKTSMKNTGKFVREGFFLYFLFFKCTFDCDFNSSLDVSEVAVAAAKAPPLLLHLLKVVIIRIRLAPTSRLRHRRRLIKAEGDRFPLFDNQLDLFILFRIGEGRLVEKSLTGWCLRRRRFRMTNRLPGTGLRTRMILVPSVLVGQTLLHILAAHVTAVELAVAGQVRLDQGVLEGHRREAGRLAKPRRNGRCQLDQRDVVAAEGAVAAAALEKRKDAKRSAKNGPEFFKANKRKNTCETGSNFASFRL